MPGESESLTYTPIGVVRTPYSRGWAPEQPVEQEAEEGRFRIELRPEYEAALGKLDRFRYVYLITGLHRMKAPVEMTVSPPWPKAGRAGLFATRTPARPNPIGLHVVRLKKIEGNVLYTWPVDAFDGTPVLDIKPYFRDLDSKEDADYGWLSSFEGVRHLLEHIRGIPHEHDHEHEHNHDHAHDHAEGDHHGEDDDHDH